MNDKSKIREPINNDSMKDAEIDDVWIENSLQQHLNKQVENLDYTVISKLSAARHRAIAQERIGSANPEERYPWFGWTSALGSVTAIALVVVVGLQLNRGESMQTNNPASQISQQDLMEDLNLLSSSDDIEFYQSMELLEWMESNSG